MIRYKRKILRLQTVTAKPTASKVLVNGKEVAFDAYNISDNNYFKLRDIALQISGTEKQFEVQWDEAARFDPAHQWVCHTLPLAVRWQRQAQRPKCKTDTIRSHSGRRRVSFTSYNILDKTISSCGIWVRLSISTYRGMRQARPSPSTPRPPTTPD